VKEDEILKANPCRIKGFDAYHSPERPVSTVEHLEALADLMRARYHALNHAGRVLRLRWGGLVALRRVDVDLEVGTVRVHRKLIEVGGQLVFGPPKSEAWHSDRVGARGGIGVASCAS
jgi:hypothetical protein